MKNIIYNLIIFATTILTFTSCSKDDSISNPLVPIETTSGVFVVNEGVYGQNNSTFSYLDFTNQTVSKNLYAQANNNSPLGDNANSMYILGNKGYIAVDNSNKIEIIDMSTFKSQGFIDLGAGSSPRELYMKDTTAGYVTSLYTDQVFKFNPVTKSIVKSIKVGSKPEGIVEANGKLFIANSGFGNANTVSVIDLTTDNVISTITVGLNPRITIKGDDNNVYVVCTGTYPPTDSTGRGGVYKINSSTLKLIDSVIVYNNPGEACFVNNDIFVVNSEGAVKINFDNHSVSKNPVIDGKVVNGAYGIIYSIIFDKNTQTIYCGNPKNFTQTGELVAFTIDGVEKARYSSGGINPGSLVLMKK